MRTLFILALVVTLAPLGATQQEGGALPFVLLRWGTLVPPTASGSAVPRSHLANNLPFCPIRTCLYYAGDFDPTNPDSNGLINSNSEGSGEKAKVWVGIKPDRDVAVSGATFNSFLSSGQVGVNPTPFAVRVGIKPGQGGTTLCAGRGNATANK